MAIGDNIPSIFGGLAQSVIKSGGDPQYVLDLIENKDADREQSLRLETMFGGGPPAPMDGSIFDQFLAMTGDPMMATNMVFQDTLASSNGMPDTSGMKADIAAQMMYGFSPGTFDKSLVSSFADGMDISTDQLATALNDINQGVMFQDSMMYGTGENFFDSLPISPHHPPDPDEGLPTGVSTFPPMGSNPFGGVLPAITDWASGPLKEFLTPTRESWEREQEARAYDVPLPPSGITQLTHPGELEPSEIPDILARRSKEGFETQPSGRVEESPLGRAFTTLTSPRQGTIDKREAEMRLAHPENFQTPPSPEVDMIMQSVAGQPSAIGMLPEYKQQLGVGGQFGPAQAIPQLTVDPTTVPAPAPAPVATPAIATPAEETAPPTPSIGQLTIDPTTGQPTRQPPVDYPPSRGSRQQVFAGRGTGAPEEGIEIERLWDAGELTPAERDRRLENWVVAALNPAAKQQFYEGDSIIVGHVNNAVNDWTTQFGDPTGISDTQFEAGIVSQAPAPAPAPTARPSVAFPEQQYQQAPIGFDPSLTDKPPQYVSDLGVRPDMMDWTLPQGTPQSLLTGEAGGMPTWTGTMAEQFTGYGAGSVPGYYAPGREASFGRQYRPLRGAYFLEQAGLPVGHQLKGTEEGEYFGDFLSRIQAETYTPLDWNQLAPQWQKVVNYIKTDISTGGMSPEARTEFTIKNPVLTNLLTAGGSSAKQNALSLALARYYAGRPATSSYANRAVASSLEDIWDSTADETARTGQDTMIQFLDKLITLNPERFG